MNCYKLSKTKSVSLTITPPYTGSERTKQNVLLDKYRFTVFTTLWRLATKSTKLLYLSQASLAPGVKLTYTYYGIGIDASFPLPVVNKRGCLVVRRQNFWG